jgi:chemotaxis protein MotA
MIRRSTALAAAPPQGPLAWTRRIDTSAALGLGAGIIILAIAMSIGGPLAAFIDLPSLLIVLGGTASAVAVCCSPQDVAAAARASADGLLRPPPEPGRDARALVRLAGFARQNGLLALQRFEPALTGQGELRRLVQLIVDGTPPEEIDTALHQGLQSRLQDLERSVGVLRKAAELAPAMGLIGTLIGLVQMLGDLRDPAAIGPGMALALLTTLYGAVLAHMVLAPLAARLERIMAAEALSHDLHRIAVVSICRQENPRRLETALNAALPPGSQIRMLD